MTRSLIRPARLAAIGVFALAGLIFWVSFNTAQGTNIRSDGSMLRLSDLIQERSRQNAELDSQAAALRRQVDKLARRDDGSTRDQDRKLGELEKLAGLKKISGQGLSVTLDDAPSNATAKVPGLPDPEPNDLVIHQQDLQAVVNALWQGGAKGIKVMDQRLISTSAVRCVGNTLILQGRVYSPPYKVSAVGDREQLRTALDRAPAIRNYLEYVDAYGLGWKVEEHKALTLPGYSGTVDLRQAKPLE
ncbi:DUF881 domain-containing protein [Streptomyces smyrnaeus]|uniref:DUF881 domain-containing protein n=1 Tax=Streptomyces TaxID=1883 RepID=UPI000C19558B|nr:DUF881 domain-containing protein [Streptomyces sp. B15]MBQ1118782.1 DUF881 domain-containing protein [Streptomyces sp. B15]MBQ1157003.1 DUF881 domain-containing protein [Streptomyces sp. A73]